MEIIKIETDNEGHTYINIYRVEEKNSVETHILIDSTLLEEDSINGR